MWSFLAWKKCLKRCLVSGSLIFLIVCHHLGLGPVFGLHRRYQQADVFPNAGIRFRLPQSVAKGKILHLDGRVVLFSSCFQDISGRVQLKMEFFALDISSIKIFVSSTLNLYKFLMILPNKRIPFNFNLPIFLSVCPDARDAWQDQTASHHNPSFEGPLLGNRRFCWELLDASIKQTPNKTVTKNFRYLKWRNPEPFQSLREACTSTK